MVLFNNLQLKKIYVIYEFIICNLFLKKFNIKMNQICKFHFKFIFLTRIFFKLDFTRFKTWIRILYDAFMNLYAFFSKYSNVHRLFDLNIPIKISHLKLTV